VKITKKYFKACLGNKKSQSPMIDDRYHQKTIIDLDRSRLSFPVQGRFYINPAGDGTGPFQIFV